MSFDFANGDNAWLKTTFPSLYCTWGGHATKSRPIRYQEKSQSAAFGEGLLKEGPLPAWNIDVLQDVEETS